MFFYLLLWKQLFWKQESKLWLSWWPKSSLNSSKKYLWHFSGLAPCFNNSIDYNIGVMVFCYYLSLNPCFFHKMPSPHSMSHSSTPLFVPPLVLWPSLRFPTALLWPTSRGPHSLIRAKKVGSIFVSEDDVWSLVLLPANDYFTPWLHYFGW